MKNDRQLVKRRRRRSGHPEGGRWAGTDKVIQSTKKRKTHPKGRRGQQAPPVLLGVSHRGHHIELDRLPGSRQRTRTPRHIRVCLHCNNGSVDDVQHAFFRCLRSTFPRNVALQALVSDGAYDAWEDLTENQQLSLLLLCATPGKLSLPNPDAVSTTLGRWLTGVLDSFITQPFRPLAY